MTTKKPETEVEIETTEEEATDIGFTAEEEAALDAAAKSDKPAAEVAKKPDAKPAAKAAEEEAPNPDDEIASLKKKLEAETARADGEAAKRKEAEKQKVANVDEIETGEQTRIKAADDKIAADLALAERDVADLRRQLREAKEAGELDKEDDINDKLLDAKIAHKKLIDAKEGFEAWKGGRKDFWDKERKKAEKAVQAPEQDAYNPDDYTDKARAWIDSNAQFKTDKKFRSRAIAAHYDAEAEGIAVDTPEYFKFLNERLGIGKEEATEEEQEAEDEALSDAAPEKKPEAKKPSTKVTTLPPSRSGGGSQRQEGTRIKKLTAAEREAADISGMSPEEYWDSKYGNQQ